QQNHDFTVFDTVAHDPDINGVMEAVDEQSLVAEVMRELERPVRRFGNAMKRHEAEPAVKRHRRKIVLFEDVRERPETVALGETAYFEECLRHECGRVR